MIIQGDCLEKLKDLEDNSVDSIITDPPYELGFMGKSWDNSGIAYNVDMWKECLRVLKPGGHLLSFGGTRTYHRMAVAIEDAGFEVRDMIEWVYGSGFPKSQNIALMIDKKEGYQGQRGIGGFNVGGKGEQENRKAKLHIGSTTDGSKKKAYTEYKSENAIKFGGLGTALKPAHEPICMARKPLAEKTVAENVLKYGTGGINIDESRVEGKLDGDPNRFAKTDGGWGVAEFHEAPVVRNNGRFPANLIHDNSEEVRDCFPDLGRSSKLGNNCKSTGGWSTGLKMSEKGKTNDYSDSGNASRFFKSIIYQAKASKSERNKGCEGLEEKAKVFNGQSDKPSEDMKDVEKRFTTQPKANNHPTVKPIALMEYLIKMVTPKGGIVLDPFAGSGSTLVAAKQNGFQYIGIELTEEYIPIIEARLEAVTEDRQQKLL